MVAHHSTLPKDCMQIDVLEGEESRHNNDPYFIIYFANLKPCNTSKGTG